MAEDVKGTRTDMNDPELAALAKVLERFELHQGDTEEQKRGKSVGFAAVLKSLAEQMRRNA